MRVAMVFPGQGTQVTSMGAPWQDHPAWKVLDEAERAVLAERVEIVTFKADEHIFKVGDSHQGYLNLKGYKEFDAASRPDGWNLWATLVISPAEEKKPPETKRPRIVK